ncbi:Zn-dependent exopeptidase [Aaosphaeria arxii CBS 175.79]|uniref:Zn-dependent exopeptidase n=1 Tax=Aaosphaeria arxii CBS 175.79 TaxID=1450172 RepID=A0A6A5Y479_9PLEO|nr:Zn-dependent exopeptidase [Aaosphaeria arxii CBS 175.79]KAF2020298.1 Zn-dependent exopeptidase [Aaosphaeria arxii CBS 175.79]
MGRLLALLMLLGGASACQRDWDALHRRKHQHQSHNNHAKRAEVDYPPALSDVESVLVNSFDNKSISDWSYYYTHGDHLGSHNKTMAEWTADKWRAAGFDAYLAEYPIWVTYPNHSSLTLIRPDGTTHKANLVEEVLAEDDTSSYPNLIPAYHGMSGSGNVTAEYVYVGYVSDFKVLEDAGIELKGKIALANYGGIYRGTKVKNAQDRDMAGVVIYTDPLDDGEITEENGYAAYPNGPARNPSSIQRGSVRFSSIYSGDPTTVGWASSEDSPRGDVSRYNPSIPSIPLSMKDGHALLLALQGHGVTAKEANKSGWTGAFGNITYDSGPAPGAVVNIDHLMNGYIAPVWDVIGIINGTSPDEVVVVGNHRDAWVIGGAADPNSGSAILIELANAFGKLLEKGWKPRRTIVLGSWDAEEFGLQGSTEWVESHLPWLTSTAVAYLNIDVGVSGPRTSFSGSGEIQTFVVEQMKKVLYPEGWGDFPTLYDMWYNVTEGEISPLGSGSDYASFYQNGIGCIDIGSDGGKKDPIYHYHSNYDSYAWMSRFGDPEFSLHAAIGQWLSLILYHVADDVLVPWDLPNAATVLEAYLSELNETVADSDFPDLDISPIASGIAEFKKQAANIKRVADQALAFNDTVILGVVNSKYRDFSRGFASAGGLPGRETFKNTISAPGIDNGYGADVFPAVTDSINKGDEEAANEWIEKTAGAILRAAEILEVNY